MAWTLEDTSYLVVEMGKGFDHYEREVAIKYSSSQKSYMLDFFQKGPLYRK